MKNEYLEKFIELVGPDYLWGRDGVVPEVFRARYGMVMDYSWAVPNDEALDALVKRSPIVEVGAGGGYWAALLRSRGADVVAYDQAPVGLKANEQARRAWSDVRPGPPSVARRHPERTLLLCWPPYATPMAYTTLYGYLAAGGRTLAFIGEWCGATGTDEFFELIYERMDEQEYISIPRWPGIHDHLSIYTRKEDP